jgi:hypothetical protein
MSEARQQAGSARLDLLAQRQPAGAPGVHHTAGVRVAAPRAITLGHYQHVRAHGWEQAAA